MTLRVILEIVPFGNEREAYRIGRLDISNQGGDALGNCQYLAQQYSDGDTLLKETVDGTLMHSKHHGAWQLTKRAIESLKI